MVGQCTLRRGPCCEHTCEEAEPPPEEAAGTEVLAEENEGVVHHLGVMVGGSRDEHGCIGSAGYSWCPESHSCIRFWEEDCQEEGGDLLVQESTTRLAGLGVAARSSLILLGFGAAGVVALAVVSVRLAVHRKIRQEPAASYAEML